MRLAFAIDNFKLIYLAVTLFAWLMMAVFTPRYMHHHGNKKRFWIFSVLTLIGTAGVFASGNLLTLFMFFELMSMASYVWVAQEESHDALVAGDTYMAVAVIGGLVLLMGLFLLYTAIGTLDLIEIQNMPKTSLMAKRGMIYAASGCMLFGFGAKAGAFPLHIWLPKAHPIAPAPASALLSGILTKTGVYGIIVVCITIVDEAFFGWLVMVIAIITMVVGAVLAIFSTNLKRTLACSSVSQIGFILSGVAAATIVGMEGGVGIGGALIHMINHSVIKLVLFLCAGVVYQNLHKLELNDVRGFGKKKPFLMFTFFLGAVGIGGIPGFNGYVSKTLLHHAIDECLHVSKTATEICLWIFVISGGLTVAYMLKLFMCLFVENNTDSELQEKYNATVDYMSVIQKVAILIPALMIPVIGLALKPFTGRLAVMGAETFGLEMEGLSLGHIMAPANLVAALESIGIGVVLYFAFIRRHELKHGYINVWPKWLDIENGIYRPLLLKVIPSCLGAVTTVFDKTVDTIAKFINKVILKELPRGFREKELTDKQIQKIEARGTISRTLSFGLMLSCVGLFFLLGYLLYLIR